MLPVAERPSASYTCSEAKEGRMPRRIDRLFAVGIRATARLMPAIFLSTAATAATSPAADTIAIEASGEVPGFTHAELVAYLAQKMQGVGLPSWHFVAAQGGAAPANRIVWSFKTLRQVWKGAAHNGFPSPTNSVTYLSTEVKLYLGGAYQMTMTARPSTYGGPSDEALSEMVHRIAQTVFVEKKP
jgi:hypothetical protein